VSSFTPYTYQWSNSGINNGDSTFACAAGIYTVTITDAVGCTATHSATVYNDIIPVASYTANPASPVTPGQLINLTSTSTISSGSITSTVWTYGDGNGASGTPVSHSYTSAGTFPITLVVTGSSGCADTLQFTYIVDAVIEIPNVITPNGDNVNEFLKFKNLEVFNSNNIIIYNRWGKKIYEQDNYKNDWSGGGYNDGTYFFILSIPEATPNIYKGYFQLIR
jgi:gliding motility-associated-like protein